MPYSPSYRDDLDQRTWRVVVRRLTNTRNSNPAPRYERQAVAKLAQYLRQGCSVQYLSQLYNLSPRFIRRMTEPLGPFPATVAERARALRQFQRREAWRNRRTLLVNVLRNLFERLGRAPTLQELSDAMTISWQAAALTFVHYRKGMSPMPYRRGLQRWFALARVPQRKRGAAGHVQWMTIEERVPVDQTRPVRPVIMVDEYPGPAPCLKLPSPPPPSWGSADTLRLQFDEAVTHEFQRQLRRPRRATISGVSVSSLGQQPPQPRDRRTVEQWAPTIQDEYRTMLRSTTPAEPLSSPLEDALNWNSPHGA